VICSPQHPHKGREETREKITGKTTHPSIWFAKGSPRLDRKLYTEPAATTIAGIIAAKEKGILDAKSNVLAMITGNGLKDIQGALRAVGTQIDVEPSMAAVLAIIEKN